MDRSYMLNSYMEENENNLNEQQQAQELKDKLEFRINGSKTIDEIKKQVSIFLEKNNVPPKIEEDLIKICDTFNESTDVYVAEKYIEDYIQNYLEEKDKEYNKSNETVTEIKQEVVDEAKKSLEEVGITMTGDTDSVLDSIQSERDVFKIKENVEVTTNYFANNTNENSPTMEIPVITIEESINNPTTDTILEETIQNNNVNEIVINEDTSIEINGDVKDDSINFAAMMTDVLVTTNNDNGFDARLDMKFVKENENDSKFKIIYGNFPINEPGNKLNPETIYVIRKISESYDPSVDYFKLLESDSIELATSLKIIENNILNQKGSFKMAVKTDGLSQDIIFAMSPEYYEVSNAFSESGATVVNNGNESVVKVNNNTIGEKIVILTTTLENLDKKNLEKTEPVKENNYQKKLVLPDINQAANAHNIFLAVTACAEVLLLILFIYFIFK